MAINRAWHEKHKMPKNATETERMNWYKDHAINCNCRPIPDKVKALIKKQQAYSAAHVT